MDRSSEIIKKINYISGSISPYQVFADWLKCTALAIAQTVVFSKEREGQYLDTIKNYDASEFAKLAALLTETCECEFKDVLGSIYMSSGWGSKSTGQFFTPYSVSKAVAKLQKYDEPRILMNEPAAGAGGMVIAVAETLKEKGVNYQRTLKVIAQDLEWTALYMCYIQLSLYGIDAKVVQGDTLQNEKVLSLSRNVFLTPMYLINGCEW